VSGDYGYAGRLLRVDLSAWRVYAVSTTDYVDFVGGRGMAAKIHWDEVLPHVGAFDPANRLTFLTGPLTGFAGFASSRCQVCGKSPATDPEHFCYSNLGGTWGVTLKSAGYDGIIVYGKADRPVYLLVDQGGAQLRDAGHIWGKGAIETRETLKSELGRSVNVVACGQAGENKIVAASLLADMDSSGSSGFGAVMGAKKLKAIAVVKGSARLTAAHPDRLGELVHYYCHLRGDKHEEWHTIVAGKTRREYCPGCPGPCIRIAWKAEDGVEGKFCCHSALFYQGWAQRYYGHEGAQEGDVPFKVAKLCDNYGIDTIAVDVIMSWLSRCYAAGIITEEETGLPLSKAGSLEYAATLLHKIAYREGFGDLIARGVRKAAEAIGRGAADEIGDLLHKAQQSDGYGARLYIVNGLLYAMEPRMPIQQLHQTCIPVLQWLGWTYGMKDAYVSSQVIKDVAARFFGGEAAADFFSYEGKALAVKLIQDREYSGECLILCDYGWPVMTSPDTEDHVGDPSLESKLLSAVTGKGVDEKGFYRIGEKAFNLQRAVLAREGHGGRKGDSLPEFIFNNPLEADRVNPEMLVPGPGGKPASRRGMVLDREKFEKMKDEYYQLRGWDAPSGRQTRWKLQELGLGDVADELERRGLLA
jgi:aldehyde:ferredoxin oxidoreductase